MNYDTLARLRASFCALNPDETVPTLAEIGIRKPAGSREKRRRMKAAIHATWTAEKLIAALSEGVRRPSPAFAKAVQSLLADIASQTAIRSDLFMPYHPFSPPPLPIRITDQ